MAESKTTTQTRPLTVLLSKDLHDEIKRIAASQHRSKSKMAVHLLTEALAQHSDTTLAHSSAN